MAPVATVLLVLFSTSVATRNGDSEHIEMSLMNDEKETMEKKKPTYGEACECSAESPDEQPWDCCDKGLVCSRSSKTCKPALGKQCTPSWIPGYTDCAKGTYNADIKCKPYADKPEKGWCCIKTGSEVPRAGFFSEPCCDGHTRWKGAKMYCSGTAEE
mmetsp:Transcript_11222/g.23362  ORF Transcript_11222/g.23362 Transcript_11222/m.23362 type:complete len:158 (-) Transcript_11222:16-489(-)